MNHDDMKKTFLLTKPDDAHLHLRDGIYLAATVPAVARCFARAVVMPNLTPPLIHLSQVLEYRRRIMEHVPDSLEFEPLMTLYLTESMSPDLMAEAKSSGSILGFKLYPKGATTHSEFGVSRLKQIYPLLEAMQAEDLSLLVHGESIDPEVDVFDREAVFLDELYQLIHHFPQLRIVLEHITTAQAVEFVRSAPKTVAATITAHHLLLNRNDLFQGGLRPHYYCLPVLKRRHDQSALIEAATSGNPKFFLGTDSAPHSVTHKESACGCAGIYSSPSALELYAEIFEAAGCLSKLEAFASFYAADFYGLPRNKTQIKLTKEAWVLPKQLVFGDSVVIPLRAGEPILWRVVS